MEFNLNEEYNIFFIFVKNNPYIEDNIKNNLGVFLSFNYWLGDHDNIESKKYLYYLAVTVKKKDKDNITINYDEEIGIIYYDNEEGKVKELCKILRKPNEKISIFEFKKKYYDKCLVKGLWKKFLP